MKLLILINNNNTYNDINYKLSLLIIININYLTVQDPWGKRQLRWKGQHHNRFRGSANHLQCHEPVLNGQRRFIRLDSTAVPSLVIVHRTVVWVLSEQTSQCHYLTWSVLQGLKVAVKSVGGCLILISNITSSCFVTNASVSVCDIFFRFLHRHNQRND